MSNQPTINLQEKRDIGQVLNVTFAFIKLTFKYIYRDLSLMAAPFFILYGLIVTMVQMDAYSIYGAATIYTLPLYYVAILCLCIGWTIACCIIGNYVLQYKINRNTDFDVSEVRRAVRKDFFKLFFAFLLLYLALILGFILLIIPGIYLAVAYSLVSTNVILDKELGILGAFRESRRLISDNWWRSVGLGLLITLIIYAFTFVFSLPNMIYTFIIALHRGSGDVDRYRLPLIICSAFAQLAYCFTAPISVVASAVYYYSLKEEKDQSGLMQKIDEFGKNDAKANEGVY